MTGLCCCSTLRMQRHRRDRIDCVLKCKTGSIILPHWNLMNNMFFWPDVKVSGATLIASFDTEVLHSKEKKNPIVFHIYLLWVSQLCGSAMLDRWSTPLKLYSLHVVQQWGTYSEVRKCLPGQKPTYTSSMSTDAALLFLSAGTCVTSTTGIVCGNIEILVLQTFDLSGETVDICEIIKKYLLVYNLLRDNGLWRNWSFP